MLSKMWHRYELKLLSLIFPAYYRLMMRDMDYVHQARLMTGAAIIGMEASRLGLEQAMRDAMQHHPGDPSYDKFVAAALDQLKAELRRQHGGADRDEYGEDCFLFATQKLIGYSQGLLRNTTAGMAR